MSLSPVSLIFQKALKKYLKIFVKDYSSHQFKGWELKDLEFNAEVLEDALALPRCFRLSSVTCNRLKIDISIASFPNKPATIYIDRVNVVIEEAVTITPPPRTALSKSRKPTKKNRGMVDMLMAGLKLELREANVFIRMMGNDLFADRASPEGFLVIAHIRNLAMRPTNSQFQDMTDFVDVLARVGSTAGSFAVHRKIDIGDISIEMCKPMLEEFHDRPASPMSYDMGTFVDVISGEVISGEEPRSRGPRRLIQRSRPDGSIDFLRRKTYNLISNLPLGLLITSVQKRSTGEKEYYKLEIEIDRFMQIIDDDFFLFTIDTVDCVIKCMERAEEWRDNPAFLKRGAESSAVAPAPLGSGKLAKQKKKVQKDSAKSQKATRDQKPAKEKKSLARDAGKFAKFGIDTGMSLMSAPLDIGMSLAAAPTRKKQPRSATATSLGRTEKAHGSGRPFGLKKITRMIAAPRQAPSEVQASAKGQTLPPYLAQSPHQRHDPFQRKDQPFVLDTLDSEYVDIGDDSESIELDSVGDASEVSSELDDDELTMNDEELEELAHFFPVHEQEGGPTLKSNSIVLRVKSVAGFIREPRTAANIAKIVLSDVLVSVFPDERPSTVPPESIRLGSGRGISVSDAIGKESDDLTRLVRENVTDVNIGSAFVSEVSPGNENEGMYKHPEYMQMIRRRVENEKHHVRVRYVTRRVIGGLFVPSAAFPRRELVCIFEPTVFVYDRDFWFRMYSVVLDNMDKTAELMKTMETRFETVVGIVLYDYLKLRMEAVDPTIIVPPYSGHSGPSEIASQILRVHFRKISMKSVVPSTKPFRIFEEGLFSTACDVFPSKPSDFCGLPKEDGEADINKYKLQFKDAWAENLPYPSAPPMKVLSPVNVSSLCFVRSFGVSKQPHVEFFLHVEEFAVFVTRLQFLYFVTIMDEKLDFMPSEKKQDDPMPHLVQSVEPKSAPPDPPFAIRASCLFKAEKGTIRLFVPVRVSGDGNDWGGSSSRFGESAMLEELMSLSVTSVECAGELQDQKVVAKVRVGTFSASFPVEGSPFSSLICPLSPEHQIGESLPSFVEDSGGTGEIEEGDDGSDSERSAMLCARYEKIRSKWIQTGGVDASWVSEPIPEQSDGVGGRSRQQKLQLVAEAVSDHHPGGARVQRSASVPNEPDEPHVRETEYGVGVPAVFSRSKMSYQRYFLRSSQHVACRLVNVQCALVLQNLIQLQVFFDIPADSAGSFTQKEKVKRIVKKRVRISNDLDFSLDVSNGELFVVETPFTVECVPMHVSHFSVAQTRRPPIPSDSPVLFSFLSSLPSSLSPLFCQNFVVSCSNGQFFTQMLVDGQMRRSPLCAPLSFSGELLRKRNIWSVVDPVAHTKWLWRFTIAVNDARFFVTRHQFIMLLNVFENQLETADRLEEYLEEAIVSSGGPASTGGRGHDNGGAGGASHSSPRQDLELSVSMSYLSVLFLQEAVHDDNELMLEVVPNLSCATPFAAVEMSDASGQLERKHEQQLLRCIVASVSVQNLTEAAQEKGTFSGVYILRMFSASKRRRFVNSPHSVVKTKQNQKQILSEELDSDIDKGRGSPTSMMNSAVFVELVDNLVTKRATLDVFLGPLEVLYFEEIISDFRSFFALAFEQKDLRRRYLALKTDLRKIVSEKVSKRKDAGLSVEEKKRIGQASFFLNSLSSKVILFAISMQEPTLFIPEERRNSPLLLQFCVSSLFVTNRPTSGAQAKEKSSSEFCDVQMLNVATKGAMVRLIEGDVVLKGKEERLDSGEVPFQSNCRFVAQPVEMSSRFTQKALVVVFPTDVSVAIVAKRRPGKDPFATVEIKTSPITAAVSSRTIFQTVRILMSLSRSVVKQSNTVMSPVMSRSPSTVGLSPVEKVSKEGDALSRARVRVLNISEFHLTMEIHNVDVTLISDYVEELKLLFLYLKYLKVCCDVDRDGSVAVVATFRSEVLTNNLSYVIPEPVIEPVHLCLKMRRTFSELSSKVSEVVGVEEEMGDSGEDERMEKPLFSGGREVDNTLSTNTEISFVVIDRLGIHVTHELIVRIGEIARLVEKSWREVILSEQSNDKEIERKTGEWESSIHFHYFLKNELETDVIYRQEETSQNSILFPGGFAPFHFKNPYSPKNLIIRLADGSEEFSLDIFVWGTQTYPFTFSKFEKREQVCKRQILVHCKTVGLKKFISFTSSHVFRNDTSLVVEFEGTGRVNHVVRTVPPNSSVPIVFRRDWTDEVLFRVRHVSSDGEIDNGPEVTSGPQIGVWSTRFAPLRSNGVVSLSFLGVPERNGSAIEARAGRDSPRKMQEKIGAGSGAVESVMYVETMTDASGLCTMSLSPPVVIENASHFRLEYQLPAMGHAGVLEPGFSREFFAKVSRRSGVSLRYSDERFSLRTGWAKAIEILPLRRSVTRPLHAQDLRPDFAFFGGALYGHSEYIPLSVDVRPRLCTSVARSITIETPFVFSNESDVTIVVKQRTTNNYIVLTPHKELPFGWRRYAPHQVLVSISGTTEWSTPITLGASHVQTLRLNQRELGMKIDVRNKVTREVSFFSRFHVCNRTDYDLRLSVPPAPLRRRVIINGPGGTAEPPHAPAVSSEARILRIAPGESEKWSLYAEVLRFWLADPSDPVAAVDDVPGGYQSQEMDSRATPSSGSSLSAIIPILGAAGGEQTYSVRVRDAYGTLVGIDVTVRWQTSGTFVYIAPCTENPFLLVNETNVNLSVVQDRLPPSVSAEDAVVSLPAHVSCPFFLSLPSCFASEAIRVKIVENWSLPIPVDACTSTLMRFTSTEVGGKDGDGEEWQAIGVEAEPISVTISQQGRTKRVLFSARLAEEFVIVEEAKKLVFRSSVRISVKIPVIHCHVAQEFLHSHSGVGYVSIKALSVEAASNVLAQSEYSREIAKEHCYITVRHVQVDNIAVRAEYPVVVSPIIEESTNVVEVLVELSRVLNDPASTLTVEYFGLRILPFLANLDGSVIDAANRFRNSVREAFDLNPSSKNDSVRRKVFVNEVKIYPISITLALGENSVGLPVIQEGCTLNLGSYHRQRLYGTEMELVKETARGYAKMSWMEASKIFASLDAIGSPYGAWTRLRTGVAESVQFPFEGLILDDTPGAFISGFGKGAVSLVRNSNAAFLLTSYKLLTSVSKGATWFTADSEYSERRSQSRTQHPRSWWHGLVQGVESFGAGWAESVGGCMTLPVTGARRNGTVGATIGVGKSVYGVPLKVFVGSTELLEKSLEGFHNSTVGFFDIQQRPHPLLRGDQEIPLELEAALVGLLQRISQKYCAHFPVRMLRQNNRYRERILVCCDASLVFLKPQKLLLATYTPVPILYENIEKMDIFDVQIHLHVNVEYKGASVLSFRSPSAIIIAQKITEMFFKATAVHLRVSESISE